MSLKFYVINFLMSIKLTCAYKIISEKPSTHKLTAFMSDLIGQCYPKAETFVMIFEPENLIFYNAFKYDNLNTLNIVNNYRKYEKIPEYQIAPIKGVLVMSSTVNSFIKMIDDSKWYNYKQFFIVVDNGDQKCSNAEHYLYRAWRHDILNCIFLCLNNNYRYIYTLNPFIPDAPEPWQLNTKNGSFTYFKQKFTDKSCKTLFYEKTINLGRYLVKLAADNFPPYVEYSIVNNTITNISGYDYSINKIIWNKLNVSYQVYDKYNKSFSLETTTTTTTTVNSITDYNNEKKLSLIDKVENKETDFLINSLFIRDPELKVDFAHFVLQTGITAVTPHRGYLTSTQKIFSFLPLIIAILFLITSIFGFVVLKFIIKDSYSDNFIDVLRVYLSSPLPRLPVTCQGRIFFGSILIVFMIINAVVQGNLAKILTTEKSVRNVETLSDLNNLNITALTTNWILETLKKSNVSYVELVNKSVDCKSLKQNQAYIEEELSLGIIRKNCHMPKKTLIPGLFHAYYARHRWPIFPKVKRLLLILFESGFNNHFIEKFVSKTTSDDTKKYRPLTINDMAFIFIVVIIGLFLSTTIFIFELYCWHGRSF